VTLGILQACEQDIIAMQGIERVMPYILVRIIDVLNCLIIITDLLLRVEFASGENYSWDSHASHQEH
jgi:hypothetical protein